MARYYFDVHNGDGETSDEHGILVSADGVSTEVARILTEIAREEFVQNDRRGIVTIRVRDEDGNIISYGTLTFTYEATASQ